MGQPTDRPIILVDGTNFVCRTFYALKTLEDRPKRRHIACLARWWDFIGDTAPLKPKEIYMFFDGMGRRNRDDGYKAHRPDPDPDLIKYEKDSGRMLYYAGFPVVFAQVDSEADRDIACVAHTLKKKGEKNILIFTRDKDLAQLVDDTAKLMLPESKGSWTFLDPEGVKSYYGVRPDQIADYLALVGDKSDNIQGVMGIGPAKGQALMDSFQSLSKAYFASKEEIAKVIGPKLAESFHGSMHDVHKNTALTHLPRKKVKLPHTTFKASDLRKFFFKRTLLMDVNAVRSMREKIQN